MDNFKMTVQTMRLLLLLAILPLILAGCLESSSSVVAPEEPVDPDYSTVPAPYDTTGKPILTLEGGTLAYLVHQTDHPFVAQPRDQVAIFLTLRTLDGEIVSSTYSDSATTASLVDVQGISVSGLKNGVIGMRVNEKRSLFVPPSEGFANVDSNNVNYDLRNDTIRYDVLLDRIYDN
jgi:hypothetical protein